MQFTHSNYSERLGGDTTLDLGRFGLLLSGTRTDGNPHELELDVALPHSSFASSATLGRLNAEGGTIAYPVGMSTRPDNMNAFTTCHSGK